MRPMDAATIVELAAATWPNIKNTQATRDAWTLALTRTNLYDALDAIGELAGEKRTIHVSDIVKRAARIRENLLRTLPPLPEPPVELADDPRAEILWVQTARERALHHARSQRHPVAV